MKTFQKVFPILKKNKYKILLGLVLLVLVDILQLIVPKIMQKAVDLISIPGVQHIELLKYSLLILAIAIGIAAIRYLWRLLLIGNAWMVDRDVRQMYYDHLMSLSSNFFNRSHTGDLMAYATNDLNAVRMLMGFGFVIVVDILLMSIASILFMININLRLTLLAIIPMPILSLIIIFFGKKIHYHFKRIQLSFATMSGQVQESLSGIRVVKAFVQEETEVKRVSKSAYDYVKENIALVRIFGVFHPALFTIISISMAIVLVYGGQATILQEISMGEFIAFFSYLGMFVWPMIAIGWFVNLYQRGKASMIRLNTIFDVNPDIVDRDVDPNIEELKGNIEIKNLSFKYGEKTPLIFNDISFNLKAGDTLAIVGRTGCGKSTLIDLLTRLYNPPENSIFLDGHDIYRISLKNLHRNIITVPQDIFLFSTSVLENIRLGKPEATRHDVEEAAKNAQIYNDILDFKEGFDTVIGERGVTLSGGQKQRLAIARALLADPQILVMDDSLSAVDTKTEKDILNNLINLRSNKTTIIIAHRISSLQHAEKIIVIADQKIIENGDHETLLKNGKLYSDLFEKQKIEEKLTSNKDWK